MQILGCYKIFHEYLWDAGCKRFRSRSFRMKRCSKGFCHVSIAIKPCSSRCSNWSYDTTMTCKAFWAHFCLEKVFTTELALSRCMQKIKQVLPNLCRVKYLKQVSINMPNSICIYVSKFIVNSIYIYVSK